MRILCLVSHGIRTCTHYKALGPGTTSLPYKPVQVLYIRPMRPAVSDALSSYSSQTPALGHHGDIVTKCALLCISFLCTFLTSVGECSSAWAPHNLGLLPLFLPWCESQAYRMQDVQQGRKGQELYISVSSLLGRFTSLCTFDWVWDIPVPEVYM